MQKEPLPLEQQFALQAHKNSLRSLYQNFIDDVARTKNPLTIEDFEEVINRTVDCLEDAMQMHNAAKEIVAEQLGRGL